MTQKAACMFPLERRALKGSPGVARLLVVIIVGVKDLRSPFSARDHPDTEINEGGGSWDRSVGGSTCSI